MNPPIPLPLAPGGGEAACESEVSERPNPPGMWPASWLELTADCALSFSDEKNDDMAVVTR